MNIFQRWLSSTKFIKRLQSLDEALQSAAIHASNARRFSLTKGTMLIKIKNQHREAIDFYNAKKFWWMKCRQYEV